MQRSSVQPGEQMLSGCTSGPSYVATADRPFASPSRVQRHLDITYPEALALVLRMEREGIAATPDADGQRRVLPAAVIISGGQCDGKRSSQIVREIVASRMQLA